MYLEAERFGSDDWGVDEIKAKCIGTVFVDDFHRIRIVLLPFGHLLTVGGQDQTVHDQVLKRGLSEQRRPWISEGVKGM